MPQHQQKIIMKLQTSISTLLLATHSKLIQANDDNNNSHTEITNNNSHVSSSISKSNLPTDVDTEEFLNKIHLIQQERIKAQNILNQIQATENRMELEIENQIQEQIFEAQEKEFEREENRKMLEQQRQHQQLQDEADHSPLQRPGQEQEKSDTDNATNMAEDQRPSSLITYDVSVRNKIQQNLSKISNNLQRILRRKKRMASRKRLHSLRSKRQIIEEDDPSFDDFIFLSEDDNIPPSVITFDEKSKLRTEVWNSNFKEIDDWVGLDLSKLVPAEQVGMLQAMIDLSAESSGFLGVDLARASSNLGSMQSPILQALNPYGCHCDFNMIPSPYTGDPVNKFDAACKTLQDGYRCLGIDNGSECADNVENHATVPRYMRKFDQTQLINILDRYCLVKNNNQKDSCGYNLCMVEAYFINNIFNLLQTGNRIDMTKSHKMGFDPEVNCQVRNTALEVNNEDYYFYDYGNDGEHTSNGDVSTKLTKEEQFEQDLASLSGQIVTQSLQPAQVKAPKPPKTVPDQCCGSFPLRSPYNPGSAGQKDCCNSKTIFNTITHMCCTDGTTQKLGEC